MSNQVRKEKRQKQRLKDAADSIVRLKILEGEQVADRSALTRAMDDLVELQNEHNELEISWAKASAKASGLEDKNQRLERDNTQLNMANTALRTQVRDFIVDARNLRDELRKVKAADHDASKLRRRLKEKSETIDGLQSDLSAFKKEKAAGW